MIEIILFLVGTACADYDYLVGAFPDAYVYCTGEPTVAWAKMRLYGFEEYYHVVYVQNQYYKLGDRVSVAGITFGHYSISIPADFVIRHELEHQYCQCHKTADGIHG